MRRGLAYVSGVRLYLGDLDGKPPELVESPFAESVRERSLSIAKRKAWKNKSAGAAFGLEQALWGEAQADVARVTGLGRGREPGEVVYCLDTSVLSGVFARGKNGVEHRLFHSADHRVRDVCVAPDDGPLACSVLGEAGTAGLALLARDGSEIYQVTEGDSVDLAPSFVPGTRTTLVYQTSGIGRDASGAFVALGPSSICKLDAEQGDVETLLEDPGYDFLAPRIASDGTLYCIRRPHQAIERPGFGKILIDFALFPFRILFALFQWLSFFTLRYTGKPLVTSGGEQSQARDAKRLMLYGNLIDADAASRESRRAGDDTAALVPQSWQLVRQRPGSELEVIAKGALGFDLTPDDRVIYSNGRAVYELNAAGKKDRVLVSESIERLVAL